jgi:hypothetical protein
MAGRGLEDDGDGDGVDLAQHGPGGGLLFSFSEITV